MPELPEVEVAARNLRRWATGRRVRAVHPSEDGKRIFRPASPSALETLAGATFRDVRRIGKNLMITLHTSTGPIGLWSHLGLTGKWVHRASRDPDPRFSRLDIELDDQTHLHYVDPRLFGRVRLVPGGAFDEIPEILGLGPDPLVDGIDAAALHDKLARTKLPIKVAIMDQALLPGVGNIQASEGLHRAGIDPRRPSRSLSRPEVERLAKGLLDSINYTLSTFAEAGVDGGDADISYIEERQIENPFLVYGRGGEPCPRCGAKGKSGKGKGKGKEPPTVTRIMQAQRATYFCANCQK
jgi:formamidopyrimidine-DNA glycosylase